MPFYFRHENQWNLKLCLKQRARFPRCSAYWQRSWMRVFDDESFLQYGNGNIMQKCCEMLFTPYQTCIVWLRRTALMWPQHKDLKSYPVWWLKCLKTSYKTHRLVLDADWSIYRSCNVIGLTLYGIFATVKEDATFQEYNEWI